jgi:AhpD family alkylhydroperoxidase
VTPVHEAHAVGLVADVYRQIRSNFMLAGPLTLHSPAPEVLAGAWSGFAETLLVGQVARELKEAVAAAVSRSNRCPFCVDAHAMAIEALTSRQTASAVERGEGGSIPDARLRALVEWAAATPFPDSAVLRHPPFTADEAPEIIGTAVYFHYINRMVNVFLDESPVPLPGVLRGLRGIMRSVAAPMMRPVVMRHATAGASLGLVAAAEPSEDFAWASASSTVAVAFASFAAAVERAATVCVSRRVRTQVRAELAAWRGEDAGLGRGWVEERLGDLEGPDRPAARLALLTARASYQVDDGVIRAFRATRPADCDLIALTAWASLAAARRIGSWLPTHPSASEGCFAAADGRTEVARHT